MKILGRILQIFDLVGEVYHAYCSLGGFRAFVAEASARAVKGILLGVDCQYSEYHGYVAVGIECGDSLRHALAYVVEMGSTAAYHASEHYHGVEHA